MKFEFKSLVQYTMLHVGTRLSRGRVMGFRQAMENLPFMLALS